MGLCRDKRPKEELPHGIEREDRKGAKEEASENTCGEENTSDQFALGFLLE